LTKFTPIFETAGLQFGPKITESRSYFTADYRWGLSNEQ
jgi:hypothetical protein